MVEKTPILDALTYIFLMLGILIVGFCGLMAVATGRAFYLDVALAWALLSFIGTIALAKFLEGRHFDD